MRRPNTSVPWLNRNLRSLLKKKRRLYNQAKKTKNWTNYRFIQKQCKRKFRQAEWTYLNNAVQEGLDKNNSKPFWNYVKSKKRDNIGTAPLKSKGSLVTDSKSKAEILINQFASVFTRHTIPTSDSAPKFNSIEDLEISTPGVEKLLSNINPSKSPGPDSIPNLVLKTCSHELAPGLTCIYQASLSSGTLPKDWTNANITPVFKKGDKHLAENYRPISLTSVACKLLEHIICRHLMCHLERYSILTDLNHGFRPGFSCETQLLVTFHDLAKLYDQGVQIDMAILDFSKALTRYPTPNSSKNWNNMG